MGYQSQCAIPLDISTLIRIYTLSIVSPAVQSTIRPVVMSIYTLRLGTELFAH